MLWLRNTNIFYQSVFLYIISIIVLIAVCKLTMTFFGNGYGLEIEYSYKIWLSYVLKLLQYGILFHEYNSQKIMHILLLIVLLPFIYYLLSFLLNKYCFFDLCCFYMMEEGYDKE